MRAGNRTREIRRLRQVLHPLRHEQSDYDDLLEFIGDARLVLLGAASHGTQEFYAIRAAITRRLIAEKGFIGVAVDADWADAYRVNAYLHGMSDARDADDALSGFSRFPAWAWRNTEVLQFVEWLTRFNAALSPGERAGFYGLDLYSLYTSFETALTYLKRVDPEAERRAAYRFSCFDHMREDSSAHGYVPSFSLPRSTEDEVVRQLRAVQRSRFDYARRMGRVPADDPFYADLTGTLESSADQYYRAMFSGRVPSWNLRAHHMLDVLQHLVAHLERTARGGRLVVWQHNANLGDASATDVARSGELSLGQLIRERWGTQAVNVGFVTHRGTVTTAAEWGAPAERRVVPPALEGSYEELFHEIEPHDFMLFTPKAEAVLPARRLERAIGVIYWPETERISHYVEASLARQFDAVLHLAETNAVEPLDRSAQWDEGTSQSFPGER